MKRALIVDDKTENRYLLNALLQGNGWQVDEAQHGDEALSRAHQMPPDIIITDLLMPVMDGYTLLRRWKADKKLKNIPFIVYTATYTGPNDEQLALDLGADVFIIKPVEPESFMERINEVLANAAAGALQPSSIPEVEEETRYKLYSEVLVRKLEKKNRELQESNQQLQATITERKKAEERLRESEEKYRALFETAQDAIFLTDETGRFIDVNHAAYKSLGYSKEELLKLNNRKIDTDSRGYEAFQKVRNGIVNKIIFEVNQRKKDGSILPVEIIGSFFTCRGKRIALAVARDITKRKRAKEALQASLAEKEVLLREVHHRVKNNLASIVSLIELQIDQITDPAQSAQMLDLKTRIRSMALIHEALYNSQDISRICAQIYVQELTEYLVQSYDAPAAIRWNIDMKDITLPINTAISCGLIITEIVTNSLKYAFPGEAPCRENTAEPCEISLSMQKKDEYIVLNASDNGTGISSSTNLQEPATLGIRLIRLLAEHQLCGNLEINTNNGTAYTLRFLKNIHEKE